MSLILFRTENLQDLNFLAFRVLSEAHSEEGWSVVYRQGEQKLQINLNKPPRLRGEKDLLTFYVCVKS